jgi:hypothetical protein
MTHWHPPMSIGWRWLRWDDVIAIIYGDAADTIDDHHADHILWEHTPFPMADPATIYRSIVMHSIKGDDPCLTSTPPSSPTSPATTTPR